MIEMQFLRELPVHAKHFRPISLFYALFTFLFMYLFMYLGLLAYKIGYVKLYLINIVITVQYAPVCFFNNVPFLIFQLQKQSETKRISGSDFWLDF